MVNGKTLCVNFLVHIIVDVICWCVAEHISPLVVAWVVGRNECYPPHPGSILLSDMYALVEPLNL